MEIFLTYTTYFLCLSTQPINNTFFIDGIGANYDNVLQNSDILHRLTECLCLY